MKSKLYSLLKPKTKKDIIRDLSNLSQKEKDRKLINSSYLGQLNFVKILLKSGADINAKNQWGETSLFWASINNHKEIVQLLKKHGAKL